MQSYIYFKMNLTTKQITFLRNVPADMKVDMSSGWRHHYFDGLSLSELSSFIKLIGDDKIYLIIPLFGSSISKAKLNLSEPFLIDNKSNSDLIIKFILEQWNSSGFNLNQSTLITFSLKLKRVWIYSKY